ncbi:serine/threonine-protein kinase [Rubritalea spongiae]|uniref:Serine/threonine-protein kinase n=1 Tax=Rubritalea spongiae TaxID=430797 RepID=A0ABW5E414_9BACT
MAKDDTLRNEEAQRLLSWALTEKLDGPVEVEEPDLPGFDVLAVLGRGGMGTVYLARHHGLGREVAVKLFTAKGSEQELFVERLKREGRLMAQLEHPNVLGIYDADVLSDGTPYLVLEYVKGEDLQKRIAREKKLSQREALSIAIRVLNGLSAVHALGVIHRDVKPANVLLGEGGCVKVTDFGVSKEAHEERLSLTMTGTAIGTMEYMSPEQANGESVDERADIYSVGVLLYEMLSGITPRGAFEPLTKYGVSKQVNRLVLRCLQRDPNKRPASAANLARQLRKVQRESRRGGRGDVKKVSIALLGGGSCVLVASLFILREMRVETRPEQEPTGIEEVIVRPEPVEEWDLLDGYGVEEARVSGKWWRHAGALLCESSGWALIQFPTDIPTEYRLDLEYTRVDKGGNVVVFLPTSQGLLGVEMSADGFLVLGGNQRREMRLKEGVDYQIRIEVTEQVLRVFLRERRVMVRALEALDLSIPEEWQVKDLNEVAIGAQESGLIVNKFQLRTLK